MIIRIRNKNDWKFDEYIIETRIYYCQSSNIIFSKFKLLLDQKGFYIKWRFSW